MKVPTKAPTKVAIKVSSRLVAAVAVSVGAVSAGAVAAAPAVAYAGTESDAGVLTVTSSAGPYETGGTGATYELVCAADGSGSGSHPQADEACARLDALAAEGSDPFAPVPADAFCTQQYGGPQTARVTGTWHGRRVNAEFDRRNGCEIGRWNRLVPVLPEVAGAHGGGSAVPGGDEGGAGVPGGHEGGSGIPVGAGTPFGPVRAGGPGLSLGSGLPVVR